MLRKANNVFSVILGDVAKTTANLPGAGTVVTSSNLEAGAIIITDLGLRALNNAAYTALTATDQFLIIQGKGPNVPLMKSPVLTKGKIKTAISKFKPAVQQVSYVGYNTVTATTALPVANNTDFWIKIRKRDNDAANRSQPMSLFAGPVRTDGSGTQAELANLLVRSGYRNFANEPANGYLRMESVCSGTAIAITGAPTSYDFTYGAKGVAINGTATSNVNAGDWIRLGVVGSVTSAVYLVAAVTATQITLSSPFVGTTGNVLAAGLTVIPAATALASNFGVRILGVAAPFDVNAMRNYYANRFTTSFSDTTTSVTVSGAQNGNGVWQQVAMDEYMNYGFEGQNGMLGVPPAFRDQVVKIPGVAGNTALTSKYSALSFTWEESVTGLVAMTNGKGSVIVYLNLVDVAGVGKLSTATLTAEYYFAVTVLGLTAADFDE